MKILAKNKYLRKSEFRYNKNPNVINARGEGHTAYITVRHKNRSKINIITHSTTFFGKPTKRLRYNPNPSKPSKKPSYFSIPVWESNIYLKDKPKGFWKMRKCDKKLIRNENRKYYRNLW